MPQEQIDKVLLEEALKGKKVVRLKGGDPFLFGRGGEELELLAENDVPYEVVPGITSPIAVPAYNGIPVTHRDFTSSLHIITPLRTSITRRWSARKERWCSSWALRDCRSSAADFWKRAWSRICRQRCSSRGRQLGRNALLPPLAHWKKR